MLPLYKLCKDIVIENQMISQVYLLGYLGIEILKPSFDVVDILWETISLGKE